MNDEQVRAAAEGDAGELAQALAAESVVARFDRYTQEQHTEGIRAARERIRERRTSRRQEAQGAADRLKATTETQPEKGTR